MTVFAANVIQVLTGKGKRKPQSWGYCKSKASVMSLGRWRCARQPRLFHSGVPGKEIPSTNTFDPPRKESKKVSASSSASPSDKALYIIGLNQTRTFYSTNSLSKWALICCQS